MNDLRLKRLLFVAHNMGNCKAFYSQYCQIAHEFDPPLVTWCLGHAYLTEAGVEKLKELSDDE